MGVDEEFERVRTALRTEEQALAQEFERIDAQARAAVDASVEHVRAELATQADRIREAIAQQRHEVQAHSEELREEVEGAGHAADGGDVSVDDAALADGELPVDDAGGEVPVDDADGELPVDGDDDRPTHVDQPDGTGVDHTVPAGDEADDTIDDVERGD